MWVPPSGPGAILPGGQANRREDASLLSFDYRLGAVPTPINREPR